MDPNAEDVFDSVMWETPSNAPYDETFVEPEAGLPGPGYKQSTGDGDGAPGEPKWEGYLLIQVKDPVKELEGTKDNYISYLVVGQTNLRVFASPTPSARRRYKDFVFLRENLAKDFPACVVPPLPDKHRLEYITGDRFSAEFLERRRSDLQRFLERVAQHPTLQRSTLVRAFLESTEWNVQMHQHLAHPPGPEPASSILDNISDTLLNAFSRVRKPDERFLEMRDGVDKFEEGLNGIERISTRLRARTNDLTSDYHDLAVAVQGLGFLETGITEPLGQFSNTLLEFSTLLKHNNTANIEPYLTHIHSLISYSHAHRAVLRLRDQKQLDLEELSDYLAGVSLERDRLAAIVSGHAGSASGLGIGAYLRDKVDQLRGADDDRSRVEKMRKLDLKIKELQDAVTTAHDTSDAFSSETLKEQAIFQLAKEGEMKELLGNLADGHIEMYRQAMEEWDRVIPVIQRIRVDV
ncbi:hypothetical protein BOTBODRAFT_27166 [Botryobasidium botryosum FD-172 SS1]|uniref:Sorting nexin-4 n=1 Tax=Botryobasidium botryosum (strain FD-172 SS1) TaxID=930990 RepID=A0A067N7J0_BOTB1|nr:hypothetical protein BOTBODRAFT_27166 [Botryobasidium botryosum FD-172 SS1]